MGKIDIESFGESVMKGLKAKAALNKRSLDDEVRALLKEHGLLSPEERVAEADRIRAMTPKGAKQTDSTDIVRAIRDGRPLRD